MDSCALCPSGCRSSCQPGSPTPSSSLPCIQMGPDTDPPPPDSRHHSIPSFFYTPQVSLNDLRGWRWGVTPAHRWIDQWAGIAGGGLIFICFCTSFCSPFSFSAADSFHLPTQALIASSSFSRTTHQSWAPPGGRGCITLFSATLPRRPVGRWPARSPSSHPVLDTLKQCHHFVQHRTLRRSGKPGRCLQKFMLNILLISGDVLSS